MLKSKAGRESGEGLFRFEAYLAETSTYTSEVAPRAGFEPATNRLTAGCSTTELPGNRAHVNEAGYSKGICDLQSRNRSFSKFFPTTFLVIAANRAHMTASQRLSPDWRGIRAQTDQRQG